MTLLTCVLLIYKVFLMRPGALFKEFRGSFGEIKGSFVET